VSKNILLIGGAGFLGRSLAAGLLRQGWQVGVLDRVAPEISGGQAENFVGELRDAALLGSALSRYSRVVYLAQEASTAPAADQLPANFVRNLEMFLSVLHEACRTDIQEFTLFSSGGAVYGEPARLPLSEDDPKHPASPYGVMKIAMEHYLQMTASSRGFRHLCLRPSNPFGPGQNFNGAQGLVAISMARIARGQPVSMLGEGTAIKDYLYIDDFVEAVIRLLGAGNASGPFNIGSGQGRSVREVLHLVAKAVGKDPLVEAKPLQLGDVQNNVLDISRIADVTGWKPTTTFEDGLARTWQWMQAKL
jgi:UDP-glucose 4-epimerase